MAKTTELGYDLCEGKEVKLEKDTNFKVLDKFLQLGRDTIIGPSLGNPKSIFLKKKTELTQS